MATRGQLEQMRRALPQGMPPGMPPGSAVGNQPSEGDDHNRGGMYL